MSKHHRWLLSELPQWVSDGLIDKGQADHIRTRYPDVGEKGWGRVILSSFGAVIFGLGIILFFAYNWSAIPKGVKLGLVFGSLLLAHGLGIFYASSKYKSRNLSEGMHVLGTMLFGAGIWLIAQIYHLDEHYPNALLVWGVGALALAWVMPSIAQGIIAVVLLSMWSGFEVFDFQTTNLYGPLLILFALIPLAWTQRSSALLFFSVSSFVLQLGFNALSINGWLAFFLVFFTASLVLAIAIRLRGSPFPAGASIIYLAASVVYFGLLYVLGFDLPDWSSDIAELSSRQRNLMIILPFCLAVFAWAVVFFDINWLKQEHVIGLEAVLICVATVIVLLIYLNVFAYDSWIRVVLTSGIFALHCLILIVHGAQLVSWKCVSLGCVMLTALVAVRFTDLFNSMLMRSLMFLVLGAGLFLVANFYARQKDARDVANA